jgi:thiamine biosynthesis lipoprotein
MLRLSVQAASPERALEASEAIVRAVERVEARQSTWRPGSELSRFNRAAPGEEILLSPELAGDLDLASRCARETEHAFDPGVGALVELWGLRKPNRGTPPPSPAEREAAVRASSLSRGLWLQGTRAKRLLPGFRLEEGGFGKGIALDEAIQAARAAGATRVELDFGGQIARWGEGSLKLAIARPRARQARAIELELAHGSLSTTGNSERKGGHVIDPRTGSMAPDFGSVTVWSGSAAWADCLSTALFVMGPEKALRWQRAHPEHEVLVLDQRGLPPSSPPRARASCGLRATISKASRVEFGSDCPETSLKQTKHSKKEKAA